MRGVIFATMGQRNSGIYLSTFTVPATVGGRMPDSTRWGQEWDLLFV